MATNSVVEGRDVLLPEVLGIRSKGSANSRPGQFGWLILIADVTTFLGCSAFILWARLLWAPQPAALGQMYLQHHAAVLMMFAILIVAFSEWQNLYERFDIRSLSDEFIALSKAFISATLAVVVFLFLCRMTQISRLVIMASALVGLVGCVCVRYRRRCTVARDVARGHRCRSVLIVGAGKVGRAVEHHLTTHPQLGYRVVGFLDRKKLPRVLGDLGELQDLIGTHFVDEVIVTIPSAREEVKSVVNVARQARVLVRVVPDFYDSEVSASALEYLGHLPVMTMTTRTEQADARVFKRLFDIVAASAALMIAAPLMAIVALAIRADSPGPILYRSKRIGMKGRIFTFYKFRSMVQGAETMKSSLEHLNERQDILFKISNDPRITRVGRILRKYSLDELPQFWNVLIGDMSIVGPRPPVPGEYDRYANQDRKRLQVMPGITGLWQVSARRDPSFENYVRLDRQYIENWSFALDLKIVLRTIAVVLNGTGS